MPSVSDNSASALRMQFEDVEEALDVRLVLRAKELQLFKLVDRSIDGKYWRLNYQTKGNSYGASRFRDGKHPGYDPSGLAEDGFAPFEIEEMKFYARFYEQSLDFTGQMKHAVKSRKGGYRNLVDFRFDDTAKFLEWNVATRLALGSLGTRALILDPDAVPATPKKYVAVRYAGYTPVATPPVWEAGVGYLRAGQRVDAVGGPARTGALRAGATDRGRHIIDVGIDKGSAGAGVIIELNTPHTSWAAGDWLCVYNERQAAAITGDYEGKVASMLGVLDVFDDGAGYSPYYGGVDRTASGNASLQCSVFHNSGTVRRLTPDLVNFVVEQVNHLSDGEFDMLYSRMGVQREFAKFLTKTAATSTATDNPMRYNQPGAKQKIGFNSYDVFPLGMDGKLMFVPSANAPLHSAFLMKRGEGIFLRDGPPSFMNLDGLTIRKVSGENSYTADYGMTAGGFVHKAPWKLARIDDLIGDHMTE